MLFNNTNMRTAMAYTNAVGDKVYPIIVDIKKGIKSTEEVSFVSSDINTGVLSVAFIQGNDTYNVEGAEVICSIMRPDTTTLEIPCNAVNDNIVEVPLGVNGTSQDGVYSFDFKVFKGEDKIVGTPIMNYSVSLSISNDLVVEEDDRLPVLTMLITQVNELKEETRETINQSNVATEASKEATANAISATDNANAVSERVSQETSEAISRVDNTIVELNNTVGEKISELDNAKTDMTTTVSNKVNEVETRFNALTSSQQQDAEVIDARDGETSLKARLDRDIEKAKQVYVELEGSYISTESSVGAIQDLEIKGNTVQDPNNLADIKSVGELQEDGTYKMSILSCGKNLSNISSCKMNFNPVVADYSLVKCKATTYTISYDLSVSGNTNGQMYVCVAINKETGVRIPSNVITVNDFNNRRAYGKITIPSEGIYEFRISQNNGDTEGNYLANNIQIEEGTVATPYEPYQGNKCDILLPCQLEKVGDVADRLFRREDGVWGVEKNIRTIVYNGTESWISDGSTELNNKFRVTGYIGDTKSISNLFLNTSWDKYNTASGTEFISTTSSVKTVHVSVLKSKCPTLQSFKEFLGTNNLIIKTIVVQPQFIPLPRDIQIALNSFFGTTHVYMESGEVEGTIKCKIPKSLGATVQSLNNKTDILSDRIEAIEGLKDSQNMKYETDKGYLVCKETKNGVIDDLKIEGKTLVNLIKDGNIQKNLGKGNTTLAKYSYNRILDVDKLYTFICKVSNVEESRDDRPAISFNSGMNGSGIRLNNGMNIFTFKNNVNLTSGNQLWIFYSNSSSVTSTNPQIDYIYILEGDHTQNPPSYFEGLMSVGEDVDKIEVSSVNENLFDINEYRKKENWTGSTLYKAFKIQLKPNTKYTFNRYDSCGNGLNIYVNISNTANSSSAKETIWVCHSTVSDYTNKSKEFITNETGVVYINTYLDANSNDSDLFEKVFKEFSIYEGTTPKPYTPHQSDKKRLLFYNSNGELEPIQELHEWDSIEKHSDNKWYYHKRSGKVVLNGSESIIIGSTYSNTIRFQISELDVALGSLLAISDKFSSTPAGVDVEGIDTHSVNRYIQITINKSKLPTQDVQGFKQWLQTNNVTVVYQLAEEEVYELAPLHLDSYANETLILCNSGAISPKMEFSITSHINELVKSQGDRISLLEEKMYKALKQVLAGDMYSLAELLYPEDFVEENPENEIMLLPFE